jgi:predicted metal-binding protein
LARKIVENVPPETVQIDLEKYCKLALDLGATDAVIIKTGQVIVDERVRAKCFNPKCAAYGTNANCPPHAPDLETVRKIVGKYNYAVFIYTRFPPENFTEDYGTKVATESRLKNHEIVARIESAAFNDGYYLATGLADGPCKPLYCPDKECRVLEGKGCRSKLKARHAMESWGMDAYLMAARVGWDVYPIGRGTTRNDIPHGITLGLVLIY